jgi:hypothetical protein
MAQVIIGDDRMFNAAVFGQPDWRAQEFLAEQYSNLSHRLTQTGQQFMAMARQTYDTMNNSQAMRIMRAAGRKINSLWEQDDIRRLTTIGELQHAQPVMQRWIMAEPEIRSLYQQQRLDGYSDTYIDMHPGAIGEDHYDYRRVMNGMIVDNKADDGWSATTYIEELAEEQELTLEEQVEIIDTWHLAKRMIREGREDPTSKFNSDLG